MKGTGLAFVLALAACSGASSDATPHATTPAADPALLAAQPWERDAYTHTSEILIGDALVGYLVEYKPIPEGAIVERALPTGSYRIQGVDFEDVGFVTPRGDVRRFVKGGSESLGIWRLEEGLRRFYGTESRVTLRELRVAPRSKARPANGEKGKDAEGTQTPPEGKSDEKSKEASGEAKKDG